MFDTQTYSMSFNFKAPKYIGIYCKIVDINIGLCQFSCTFIGLLIKIDLKLFVVLGGVHILRRQLGGREVFAKSLRLSTRGREGYSKCLRSFFLKYFTAAALFWQTKFVEIFHLERFVERFCGAKLNCCVDKLQS